MLHFKERTFINWFALFALILRSSSKRSHKFRFVKQRFSFSTCFEIINLKIEMYPKSENLPYICSLFYSFKIGVNKRYKLLCKSYYYLTHQYKYLLRNVTINYIIFTFKRLCGFKCFTIIFYTLYNHITHRHSCKKINVLEVQCDGMQAFLN